MVQPGLSSLEVAAARRANVYYALAIALGQPRDWGEELADQLTYALGIMPDPLPRLGHQLAAQVNNPLEDREKVAVAHARLFIGPFEILAAPWASFYLDDEPRLMGPTSQHAAKAYAEAGLAPRGRMKDAPDHVTHELEFMYFLAFNQATAGAGVWQNRQVSFWREHLGRWLPRFADKVAMADAHIFYTTLANALRTLCSLEEREFGSARTKTNKPGLTDSPQTSKWLACTDLEANSASVRQLRSVLGINYQGERK